MDNKGWHRLTFEYNIQKVSLAWNTVCTK